MGWNTIQPPSARKLSVIGLKLVIPEKRGPARLHISIPTTISGSLGFDAAGIEHCEVLLGDNEQAGQMLVRPAAEGFKIGRLMHCITVRLPPPPGLVLKEQAEEVPYQKEEGGGFIIALPAWAIPGGGGEEAPSKAAGDKPEALEFNGNTMVFGARELRLTNSQAILMRRLASHFGKCVKKQALLDDLYQLDPNGGANDKIIDVWIHKLRKALEEGQMPLTILTHRQAGWELRRAIT